MDWRLLDHAKDAQDTATALSTFLDEIPEYSKEIKGDIAELFAISSALDVLHEDLELSRYGRYAGRILRDLEICLPSLSYTLEDIRNIFNKSKRKGRQHPGAFPGTPPYAQIWEDACDEMRGTRTRCLGRDEPQAIERLMKDGFEKVLELDKRLVLRTESSLQLCRVNREDGRLDLWANLRFTLYERMVLFYSTMVAMKRQDNTQAPPGLEDIFQPGEREEFGGEIQDNSYLHAIRIFRDTDSGCVRFEATPRRGPLKTIPIWTAFVTQYIGHKSWMKRVGPQTISFRELHPYMFTDGYKLPKGPSGRYQLTFTTPKDMRDFMEIFHRIRNFRFANYYQGGTLSLEPSSTVSGTLASEITFLTMASSHTGGRSDPLAAMAHSEAHYFNSYNHHGIHEEMLKDEVRTKSYRDAIYQNGHLFKDKVVLDVGCGTSILSMFAVRAGAKHVIGVDMSTIIDKAKEIVERNGMSDKITLLQGKMEEVKLPFDKVDIIISEWMGYFLLYESMLDTVLYARDKYLVKDGLIFPDKATIFMAGIEDGEYKDEKIGFWDNVWGFDYTPLKATAMTEPLVDTVDLKAVVTDPAPVITLDLYKCTVDDLSFRLPYELNVRRPDFIHAIIAWFDIEFSACHKPIKFSTGPHTKYTHWKQTVFYLQDVLTVEEGEKIVGELENRPSEKNHRDLDITISYKLNTEDMHRQATGQGTYKMC
ncbi:Nuclear SAM-dependent mono-and asymmetric methyltransferase [Didymosphaeria variabile]|uniref:Nuclear SAM-dependent mono-and asymmetric methyltransferase n=1 Tax=Didymosphaeria variabile TaxID=1932322 RepID=A0A9W8XGR7_9PLEO|nr:Nuclear SAM-dependent mono-and asymmetric methyltransferase [Didymosphaeria variabile]KAJ4350250.1 Nuclear SAM-dependent mono-and asymmetric methyltransferase [Didymosphaeria variabile]